MSADSMKRWRRRPRWSSRFSAKAKSGLSIPCLSANAAPFAGAKKPGNRPKIAACRAPASARRAAAAGRRPAVSGALLGDQRDQLVGADRLEQVVVEAGPAMRSRSPCLAPAGQGDQQQSACSGRRHAAGAPARSRPCRACRCRARRPAAWRSRGQLQRLLAAVGHAAPSRPSSASSSARLSAASRLSSTTRIARCGRRLQSVGAPSRAARASAPAPPAAGAPTNVAAAAQARRCCATTVPPCSSTRLLHQRQADAQAALRGRGACR